MVSIKRHVLLNVKFWEPQYMKIKNLPYFLKKYLLNDQYFLNFES